MAKIISGKEISADMKVEMKKKMDVLLEKGVAIGLTVVQVGDDPASSVYVRNKAKACEFVGITSVSYTHLDVYKRQVSCSPLETASIR